MSRSKSILLPLLFAVVLPACSSYGDRSSNQESGTNRPVITSWAAQSLFEPVDTIRFSGGPLIGTISTLEVGGAHSDLLITDHDARSIWMYDSTGSFLTSLDPRACNPGFNLRPIQARYNPGASEIFLQNGGPWGYRFHLDGSCKASVSDEFTPSYGFALDERGRVYGYYPRRGENGRIRVMRPSGETIRSWEPRPSEYHAFNERYRGTDNIAIEDTVLYQVQKVAPRLTWFNLDGRRLGTTVNIPDDYVAPPEELPSAPSRSEAIRVGKMSTQITVTVSVDILEDRYVVVQYRHPTAEDGYGIQIYDLKGRLLAQLYKVPTSLEVFYDSYAYVKHQAERSEEEGSITGPYLVKYEFGWEGK